VTIKTRTTALVSSRFGSRRRGAGPRFPRRTEEGGNVHIVRSIFERWAKGDLTTEWAHPDIAFRGPDLRGGRGIDRMVSIWNDWLETMGDFDVLPDRFLDAGDDAVFILASFIYFDKGLNTPGKVLRGVFSFKLSDGKVVRLAVFIDREHERFG
jgi:SnoaL-like domain